jgi:peptidoglycan/LPS O-acetylase OafA/YrhL
MPKGGKQRSEMIGTPNNPQSSRISEVDGLRGIAILLVISFHYGWGIPLGAPGSILAYVAAPFIRLGWSGVDLFFVLSGFLIGSIIISVRDASSGLTIFYIRRAARTLPLYVVMLVIFVIGIVTQANFWIDLPRLFSKPHLLWVYFILMQNNSFATTIPDLNFISVSWSLAIEEQFYLLFPLLFLGISGVTGRLICLSGFLVLSICFRAAGPFLAVPSAANWDFFFTLCRLDGLATGAIIAVLMSKKELRANLERMGGPLLVGTAFLGLTLLAEAKWKGVLHVLNHTCFAFFYGGTLLLALLKHPTTAFLRLRFLKLFGDISYGLYLIHVPVLATLTAFYVSPEADPFGQRPIICTLIAIILSVLLAILSFHLLEQPILRMARRRRPYTYRVPHEPTSVFEQISSVQEAIRARCLRAASSDRK